MMQSQLLLFLGYMVVKITFPLQITHDEAWGKDFGNNFRVRATLPTDETPSDHITSSCFAFIKEFSEAAANFTRCSIISSRPLRFCQHCVNEYVSANSSYNLIMKSNSTDQSGAKCQDAVLKSDRIQLVVKTMNFLDDTWNNCQCPKCFDSFHINGTLKLETNNDTKHFFHIANLTQVCFDKFLTWARVLPLNETTSNSSVCEECGVLYKEMNNLYEYMREQFGFDGVCMDIVDKMNSTRLVWSNTFHCRQPEVDIIPVVLLSCFFSVLPVIFYAASKVHGTKTERKLLKQKRMKNIAQGSCSEEDTLYSGSLSPT